MSEFVSADIGKLGKFIEESTKSVDEFNRIKEEFANINSNLLKKWEGEGADEYRYETDHILENVGGIADALKGISDSIQSVKETYDKVDDELCEINKNPEKHSQDAG